MLDHWHIVHAETAAIVDEYTDVSSAVTAALDLSDLMDEVYTVEYCNLLECPRVVNCTIGV